VRVQQCIAKSSEKVNLLFEELNKIETARNSVLENLEISSDDELALITNTDKSLYKLRLELNTYLKKTKPMADKFLNKTARQVVDEQIKIHGKGRDGELNALISI
jgi:hypothetical protein